MLTKNKIDVLWTGNPVSADESFINLGYDSIGAYSGSENRKLCVVVYFENKSNTKLIF